MPNRIIKESIHTSKNVSALSDFQFRLWINLITYVDDFGRGIADAELVKGILFPRRKCVTEKQIENAFQELAALGMVSLYSVDGEKYFYFPNWDKHQTIRAKKSKYPSPSESNCMQVQANVPVIQSNPIQSESESNSVGRFAPPTQEEVEAYCKESGHAIDAGKFIDFYSSKGWKVGKDTMKDWKAAVRNWERRDKEQKTAKGADKYGSQNFEQKTVRSGELDNYIGEDTAC